MIFKKYKMFTTGYDFICDVKNTIHTLVITITYKDYWIRNAEEARESLLWSEVPNYSKINPATKDGRKKLAAHFREEIKRKEEEIERLKMLVKIATRSKVELVDKSTRDKNAQVQKQ